MFKTLKYPIYILLGTMILFSCSKKHSRLANELCNCLKESGWQKGLDWNEIPKEMNENNPCFTSLSNEIYEIMKPMNDSQRADFMREFSDEFLETECADLFFELLPYEEWMEDLSKTDSE